MSGGEPNITWRDVPDMLVASIRFNGKHEEIGKQLETLSKSAGSRACGRPFVLHRGGGDMEVCLPVTEPAEDDGVGGSSRGGPDEIIYGTLEGALMMCAPFGGDHGSDETGGALGKTFGDLWRYAIEHHIGVTEEPWREEFLDHEPGGVGAYSAELQVPMLLPKWLERLKVGLDRHAGASVRQHVLGGSDGLSPRSDPSSKVAWMKGAMARLDSAVEDEDKRREIMCGCAHVYPKGHTAKLKNDYERLGSIDALLDDIAEDPGYGGAPYYRDPERDGNVIFIEKNPQEREKHETATDPRVKRAAACHCPVVKAAILAGEDISFTFCNCGTGWFKPLWESIVEAPVKVVCEGSVLKGDESCKFAIHLPEEKHA
ncbi:MAG: hypothetical protein ABIG03_07275 [Candidatus Eisenbacteria bacterium]